MQKQSNMISNFGDVYGLPVSFVIDGAYSEFFSVGRLKLAHRAAITNGFPYMIDVQDCDARLPSVGDATDLYLDELVRLSILLGRVQKTIYGFVLILELLHVSSKNVRPSGISSTTDETLHELFNDLKRWKASLPDQLRYKGGLETSRTAGVYACVVDRNGSLMRLFQDFYTFCTPVFP